MVKTTFVKLFHQYDYTDFYNDNYEMDKDISLDIYTVVFINKSENKLIIVSDGLHFTKNNSKLFPILLDTNNSYITKIKTILRLCTELLEREEQFKKTIKRVNEKYPDMDKNIIGFSMGGIYCFFNNEILKKYKNVFTLNCPIIAKNNNNYCLEFDILALCFSQLYYNSDNHNNSKMLFYDLYKLSNSILKFFEDKNYVNMIIALHNPCNITNDEIINL
jgi:hypothetical protein